jgi:hypothetical protein
VLRGCRRLTRRVRVACLPRMIVSRQRDHDEPPRRSDRLRTEH